jgi:hypothetical protein
MKMSGKGWMALALMGGIGLATVSYNYAEVSEQWLSDLLLGIGTSVVLFVPLYIIGRRLDRHLDQVQRETATAIENVRQETQAGVDALTQRVDDLASSVSERLRAESARDVEIFTGIAQNLSREELRVALNRARELGIVSGSRKPRVLVSRAHSLFLSVGVVGPPEQGANQWVGVDLEGLDGRKLEAELRWGQNESPTDFMVRVGRALAAHDASQRFDPQLFAERLSETLLVGLSHEERRPIVEICPPQWAVVSAPQGGAIVTYGRAPLVDATSAEFMQRPDLLAHLHSKTWVNASSLDTAYLSLMNLFP